MKEKMSFKKSVVIFGLALLAGAESFAGAGAVPRENLAACKINIRPEALTTNLALYMEGLGQTDLQIDKRLFSKLTTSYQPVRVEMKDRALVMESSSGGGRLDGSDRRISIKRSDSMSGEIEHILHYDGSRLVRYDVKSEKRGDFSCTIAAIPESRFANVKSLRDAKEGKAKDAFRPVAYSETEVEQSTGQ